MTIIEISALDNGAHRNQSGNMQAVPDGWAVIPESMETKNFPFGDVTAEEIDGIMTATSWTPGEIPKPEPEPEPVKPIDGRVTELEAENKLLTAQIEAQSDQLDFYEDCIAEMASIVYA